MHGIDGPALAPGQVCERLHLCQQRPLARTLSPLGPLTILQPRKIVPIHIDNVILLQRVLVPARTCSKVSCSVASRHSQIPGRKAQNIAGLAMQRVCVMPAPVTDSGGCYLLHGSLLGCSANRSMHLWQLQIAPASAPGQNALQEAGHGMGLQQGFLLLL